MSAEENIEEINSLILSVPHEISISHMNHRGRKTTKLVGNTDQENHVKGQHRTYEFEFKKPQFVSRIRFKTADYADGKKGGFVCTYYPSGRKGEAQVANAENAWTICINSYITKFSIEPPKTYLGNQFLTAVQIDGLSPEEFSEIIQKIGEIENLQQSVLEKCQERLEYVVSKEAEVNGLNENIAELNSSINGLTDNNKELEDEVISTKNELETIEQSVNSRKQTLSEYSARIESINSSIEQKSGERQQLSSEITQSKAELRELKGNINMFPTEISGFVAQGASSIRKYTFLAAIPIMIIGLVTIDLFSKASELSHLQNLPENISVWEILIARFPYVLVCGALIASSYKLARIFISEIIRINEQRLNLTKISIIAKDVSDASENGLSLDDSAQYEHRTHLKMDLLRSHLRGYLAEGYSYSKRKKSTQDHDQTEKNTDNEDQ